MNTPSLRPGPVAEASGSVRHSLGDLAFDAIRAVILWGCIFAGLSALNFVLDVVQKSEQERLNALPRVVHLAHPPERGVHLGEPSKKQQ